MTFTRTAAFSAAALAAALVLASCTGGGDEDQESAEQEDVSIDYWYWQDDTTDTTIQDLAADFEAETGIHVNIQDDIAQPDFYDSLVNAVAAGNAPDATHLNTNMFGQLIDAGVLEDLSDRIEDWDGADAVSETLWPYVESPDGEGTYAVPNKFLMFIMYYRADLFQAAGIEVPTTQDEFVEASNAIVDTAAGRYGFDIRGGANGQDQWAAFLVAGGARFVDEDGEVVLDSPEARESNDQYVSTYESAPPGAINDGFAQIIANFQAGTASMIINHLGAADALVDALGQEAVGVALIPSASGDPADTTYMGTMNANAVLAGSEKKDAAFQWISYLAEEKAQLAITESPNGYLPVVGSVAEDPQFADDPYFQTSIEASEQAGTVAWPSIPGTTVATQQTWQPLFQGSLLGDNSTDDVITGVADALSGDG